MSNFRCIFFVLAVTFLSCLSAKTIAAEVKFVTVSGRSAITDGGLLEEAKNRALEDALYNAALAGGAKIDGFTSVQADSRLDDHFVVRPSSNILDYNILDQSYDEMSYQIKIEAAIGALEGKSCQNRRKVNINIFAPLLQANRANPAWLVNLSSRLVKQLNGQISKNSEFVVVNHSGTAFNQNKLKKDARFDYAALTGPAVIIRDSDFSMVTAIRFKNMLKSSVFAQSRQANVEIASELFVGRDFKPVGVIVDTESFVTNKMSISTVFDLFETDRKLASERKLSDLVNLHAKKIYDLLVCEPIEVPLQFKDNELLIPLGERHGVEQNQLLVSNGQFSQWTILRVSEVSKNYSMVAPLNSSVSRASLDGKTVKFLEAN